MNDLLMAGRQAAEQIGINWRNVPQDGRWHEVPADGKNTLNGAGRIKLFSDGEGGLAFNWITRDCLPFWAQSEARLDPAEREARRKRAEEVQRHAEAELKQKAAEAATKAAQLWKVAESADGNPYLERKQCAATDTLRQMDADEAERVVGYKLKAPTGALVGRLLLVPVMVAGKFSSAQLIDNAGRKHFLSGGVVKGGYWATEKLPESPGDGLTLLIAEGVATAISCRESTALCTVAALSCGNLPAVAESMRKRYPAAKLVVCSDAGNGEADANRAAADSGALLALPIFPEGTRGTDFNDLAAAVGLDEVRRQIEAAQAPLPALAPHNKKPACAEFDGDEWPELLPLAADTKAQDYPLDALPPGIKDAVDEVRRFVKAPTALVAAAALGALSTAAQSLVDIKRADRLTGPVSLFLLSLAESGERKTTIDGFFTEPIRAYQQEQIEAAKPLIDQARAEFAAWEAKRGGIVDAIKAASRQGQPTSPLEADLQAIEGYKPAMPRVPELLRGDDTPEALAYDLANRWPAGAVISSEAGIVFGSAGMGKDRALRNLALLNILWDGGELTTKRKTSDPFTVRGARLTLSLQVQEPALLEFFKQTGQLARGTGFLARFLVAWPNSTQGQRLFTEAPRAWPHLSTFNARISGLLHTPAPIQPDGTLVPALLEFSPGAKAAWVEYHDQIETMLRTGGELCNVRDVASKSADNAARLAALFHVYKHGPVGEIGADEFISASKIAAWHLNEALRFFGGLSLPVELSGAARLEGWLLDYCKLHQQLSVARRTIQQYGPYGLRENPALTAAIAELEDQGRARLVTDGKRKEVLINPALLGV